MGVEWKTALLGELVDFQRGHDLPTSVRKPGIVPVMGSAGVSGYHDEIRANGPGVTIGRSGVGSMGVVSYCPTDYWPLNTVLYATDFKGNVPRYLYYLLRTVDFRRYNSGSAQASLNRNYIKSIPLRVPAAVEAQIRIAGFLGALDDKIELNRAMNRTLEEMARAIFKSWFIDFDGYTELVDSDLGPIPRGWQIGNISELAELNPNSWNRNTAPETICYLDLAGVKWGEFSQPVEYRYDDAPSRARRKLSHGDTLIGTVRPANGSYGLILDPADGLTGSTGFAVMHPKRYQDSQFLYHWLSRREFISYLGSIADGSAYPAVDPKVIHTAECIIPPGHLRTKFLRLVEPLYLRRQHNQRESQTLAKLRDTLLPKLISGELRVREAEKTVERAL